MCQGLQVAASLSDYYRCIHLGMGLAKPNHMGWFEFACGPITALAAHLGLGLCNDPSPDINQHLF